MLPHALRAALVAVLVACSNGSTFTNDGGGDGAADGAATFTLRVDPNPDAETVVLGVLGKTAAFHAFRRDTPSSPEVDVTATVGWTIEDGSIGTPSGGGAFALQGIGGKT